MTAIQDPTKKTSINSLLNPQEASGYPHISPIGPAPVVQAQGASQLHPYDSDYPPSSFNLRAANWETHTDSRKSVNPAPVHHSYHHQPQHSPILSHATASAYSYSSSRAAGSRGDDARGYADRESAWPSSTERHHQSEPSGVSYGHVHTTERTALAGDYSNTPSTYNSTYASPADPSVWQSSYRASVRIAAKGTVSNPSSQTTHDRHYDQTAYYGHPQDAYSQTVENYPPSQGQDITVVPSPNQLQSAMQPASAFSTSAPSASKRKDPEGDGAPAPKPKRPRAKVKWTNSQPPSSSSTPGSSKRGYSAKKRSEAALISAQNDAFQKAQLERQESGSDPSVSAATQPITLVPELQFARCMSNRYKNEEFPRCVSCTRRWAGDTCRFQGIRYFMRDSQRRLFGISFTEQHSQQAVQPSPMEFPTKWNRKFEKEHICRTKLSIAKALLPTLKVEQEHLKADQMIRRPRECDVRATCDTCMTSLFATSFMCRLCGREVCNDCFQQVRALTYISLNATQNEVAIMMAKRERFTSANPFFLTCTKRNDHGFADFTAVTRFVKPELEKAIKEMEEILAKIPKDGQASEGLDAAQQPSDGAEQRTPNDSSLRGQPTLPRPDDYFHNIPSMAQLLANDQAHVHIPSHHYLASYNNGSREDFPDPVTSPIYDDYTPANAPRHITDIPIERLQIIPASYYDPPVGHLTGSSFPSFSDLWKNGVPLLFKDVLPRFKIRWTPQYFMDRYGEQSCLVVECQTDTNKRVSVREFFQCFGSYEGRTDCWKLKDWPPTADFKNTFPELYDDFSRAVPVPDYVRRDGVYNIGSHFPSNTVKPDLGPKMYNSMASSENPGSKGSTRLHMDMADAFNVMLHAELCPDGSEGYAVWDLYRAEDSDKIRAFLKRKFGYGQPPRKEANGHAAPDGSTKSAPQQTFQMIGHDPIHGQQFYLDVDLRKQLYDEYGVKSLRVYQRPGDGVFIPAGCAHQVANMSDCIKIAVDFVSPENIDRCEKLTKEFREQNQSKVWKEDVLQLRTMMWFAWQSCSLREEEITSYETARLNASGLYLERDVNDHTNNYRTNEGGSRGGSGR